MKKSKAIVFIVCISIVVIGLLYIGNKNTNNSNLKNNSNILENTAVYNDTNEESIIVDNYEVPYVGMKENQINNTMLGRATEIEKCRDFDHLKASHKVKTYRWYKNNIKSQKNVIAIATIFYWDYKNKKEVPGYIYSIDFYNEYLNYNK